MSISRLLAEIRADEYRSDRRPEPTEVEVISSEWGAITTAIENCEQQFIGGKVKQWFSRGENHAYAEELETLRTKIIPDLIQKIDVREVSIRFACAPRSGGGASLDVTVVGVVELKVFSQFYDSFTPGMCEGSAYGYVAQNLREVRARVNGLTLI